MQKIDLNDEFNFQLMKSSCVDIFAVKEDLQLFCLRIFFLVELSRRIG